MGHLLYNKNKNIFTIITLLSAIFDNTAMLMPNLAQAETKWITVLEGITSHTERALQYNHSKYSFQICHTGRDII
jgi:hypothetical protein